MWAHGSFYTYGLFASGIAGATGYTLRSFALDNLNQTDSLYVPNDSLPAFAVEAETTLGCGAAVVGTRYLNKS